MKNYRRRRFVRILTVLLIFIGIFGYIKRTEITQKVVSLSTESNIVSIDTKKSTLTENQQLSLMTYKGQAVIQVNDNKPTFSASELGLKSSGWQKLSPLDWLGRPRVANALLNQKLMPPSQKVQSRERLTTKTPGYHAIKTGDNNTDWLYNRSHLIGYQFTGLNNDPKNLITGTRQLNADSRNGAQSMVTYEIEIANYLKASPEHYVRYQVEPIYRNVELVPRGVHMMAQSLSSDALLFNIYIFNVQDNWTINYQNGQASQ